MYTHMLYICGFPGGTVLKNLPASAGDARDVDSIPGTGSSPGEGNGNPLQYSCLKNLMDRGAWQATARGLKESDMTERLNMQAHTHTHIHTHTTHTHTHTHTHIYIYKIWRTNQIY